MRGEQHEEAAVRTRILAVDDDPTNLEILEELFCDDYDLTLASSGEEALRAVVDHVPDIVLLDVMMPGIDGYETCRRLRALPGGRSAKVLLVSARAMPEDCIRGYEAGADDYVCKPFVHEELQAKVRVFQRLCSVEELLVERTEANEKLREALVAAKAATAAKTTFLANVSHELRTPLAGVLGFAEVLRGRVAEGEDAELIDTILSSGKHLLYILNDLLDVARAESGEVQFEFVRFSPMEVVYDVVRLLAATAAEKGIELSTRIVERVPASIAADLVRLRQALLNLVGNAVKFTEVGSVEVVVRLGEEIDGMPRLLFDVVDTGPGMEAEQLREIFKPFTQADASITRTYGGTGLGLTISKGLAMALGGDVTVSSVPGEGCAFSLSIRCGMLDGVPLIDAAGYAKSQAKGAIAGGSAEASERAKPDPIRARVLVAEDTRMIQKLVHHVLTRVGAEVTIVENGLESIHAIEAAIAADNPFDVVLMDLQMPVMGGLRAVREIRSRNIEVPIIALTASATPDARGECMAAGFTGFAGKPVDVKELIARVRDVVSPTLR